VSPLYERIMELWRSSGRGYGDCELQVHLEEADRRLVAMREERDAQARLVDCYRQEKADLQRQLAAAQADKERVVDTAVKLLGPGCDEYQALVRAMSFDAFYESTRGKCLHCIERDRDTAEGLCVELLGLYGDDDSARTPDEWRGDGSKRAEVEAMRKRQKR